MKLKITLVALMLVLPLLFLMGAGTDINGNRTVEGNLTVKGTCTGCGGTANTSTEYVNYGSEATCNAGNNHLISYLSASFYSSSYCDGSTRHWFGLLGEAVPPPVTGSWTQVNLSTSTFTGAGGIIYLGILNNASLNVRMIEKAQPSTPYTVESCFLSGIQNNVSASVMGVGFYDGTKIEGLSQLNIGGSSTTGFLRVDKFTNVTTSASVTGTIDINIGGPVCVQLTNNSTTMTLSYSIDRQSWVQILSEAVGTFMTPTAIGFYGFNETSSAANVSTGTLFHWKTF